MYLNDDTIIELTKIMMRLEERISNLEKMAIAQADALKSVASLQDTMIERQQMERSTLKKVHEIFEKNVIGRV